MVFSVDMAKKIIAQRAAEKKIAVPPVYEPTPTNMTRRIFPWRAVLIGAVVLLGIAAFVNKGWVVAAVVDGAPLFSWDLNKTLRTRYGQQTLEGMIGEALIAKEAKKSGVTITDEELKSKQKEILASLGTEVNLEDFLKFQGLTEEDFNQQLRVQLMVERLLTKNLTLTDADIDNYIATNRALLTATEPAQLKEEAKKAIIGNVVSEKLQPWFLELRQKAKIMKFL